jgi:hypothetical protein
MGDIMAMTKYAVVNVKIIVSNVGLATRSTLFPHDVNVIIFFNHHVPHLITMISSIDLYFFGCNEFFR